MSRIRTGFTKTDDGLQLYWRAVGEGPPIVCCNGVGVSTFFFKYIVQHFRSDHTVIIWDYRGHGRSSLPADLDNADLTIERSALDLKQVLEDIGLDEEPMLFGHSMGCQVLLEYAKQNPGTPKALVPMFGTFARPLDTFMDSQYSRSGFELIRKVALAGGRNGNRALLPLYASPVAFAVGRYSGLVDKYYADPRDINRYMEHLVHLDPRIFLNMVHKMADHDLTDFLPEITCPTLVIAGERDLFTPLHRSKVMAASIPGAELLILPEASHAAIVEHPDTINRRIRRFLHERLGEPTV